MHLLNGTEIRIVDECLHCFGHTAYGKKLTIVLAHLLVDEVRHWRFMEVRVSQHVKHLV